MEAQRGQARDSGSRGKHVGEDRAGGLLHRLRGGEGIARESRGIIGEQVLQGRSSHAGVEHADAGAQDGLAVQAVRQADARHQIVLG